MFSVRWIFIESAWFWTQILIYADPDPHADPDPAAKESTK